MTAPIPTAPGAVKLTNLTGAELVSVISGGPIQQVATTAQIAGLAATGTAEIKNTAITTVGNGTLTAAGLVGGLITRTGPTSAYTDTPDTAALILAALPGFVLGSTFFMSIKNATAFLQTLGTSTGVTWPATNIIGPFEIGNYFGTVGGTAGSPTIAFTHLGTTAIGSSTITVTPLISSLSTVGAGTITAAMINGGFISRSGSQSNAAFADTTDTAANIIAGNPGLIGKIGASMLVWYQNGTNANATIGGGTGVTVSGLTVVPGGTWTLYLLTYTAAATITMVGVGSSGPVAASGTFTLNGVTPVTVADSRVTANSVIPYTLKTVGGSVGVYPHIATITPGTGFTILGTAADTSVYNYTIIG